MYYLHEGSFQSGNPVLQKIDAPDAYFCGELRIAQDWAMRSVYEKSVIEWSKQLIRPDQNFLDIGAHVGTYALSFAPHVAGVYAFECSPRTYNLLCGNIALRDMDYKVKAFNTALGDVPGTADYFMRSIDGGSNGIMKFEDDTNSKMIQVPVATLDSFHLENIGLIKMDVEGFEKSVLKGGLETLRRNNYPKILFESWAEYREHRNAKELRRELFSYLESIGYMIIPIRGWDELFLAEYRRV